MWTCNLAAHNYWCHAEEILNLSFHSISKHRTRNSSPISLLWWKKVKDGQCKLTICCWVPLPGYCFFGVLWKTALPRSPPYIARLTKYPLREVNKVYLSLCKLTNVSYVLEKLSWTVRVIKNYGSDLVRPEGLYPSYRRNWNILFDDFWTSWEEDFLL